MAVRSAVGIATAADDQYALARQHDTGAGAILLTTERGVGNARVGTLTRMLALLRTPLEGGIPSNVVTVIVLGLHDPRRARGHEMSFPCPEETDRCRG
jgi:hypothetical protein